MADPFITTDELKQFVRYTKPGSTDDDELFETWVEQACDEVAGWRGVTTEPWPAWCTTAALLIGKHLWRQNIGKSVQAAGPDPRKEADRVITDNTIPSVGMA